MNRAAILLAVPLALSGCLFDAPESRVLGRWVGTATSIDHGLQPADPRIAGRFWMDIIPGAATVTFASSPWRAPAVYDAAVESLERGSATMAWDLGEPFGPATLTLLYAEGRLYGTIRTASGHASVACGPPWGSGMVQVPSTGNPFAIIPPGPDSGPDLPCGPLSF